MRALLTAALGLVLFAAPAAASTLQRVDFAPHQSSLAIGLLDANFDTAVSDRLSLGASLGWAILGMNAAVRSTWRTDGDPDGFATGWGFNAGYSTLSAYGSGNAVWLQPAWLMSSRLGGSNLFLRASLGPALWFQISTDPTGTNITPVFEVLPNVELAYRFHRYGELTLGGNSLLGFRAIF